MSAQALTFSSERPEQTGGALKCCDFVSGPIANVCEDHTPVLRERIGCHIELTLLKLDQLKELALLERA
ncbi:hypothetical protein BC777_0473 [Yoonia maricola]|uniref:Uncharacterized protein n=1 Tax=Yoonia maricola TaxID=420999 RepID=A0A2M8WL40_9RHOB|nr:hypothetical protein [Yoonia maricola]PJI91641.1 hypothetical protein BC777_0473 [Yoonia maricola]